MNCIGLTGGIACGKSTVAALLEARGIPVVDADRVAREVVRPGTPVLAAIVRRFGVEVLRADGALDRARLGGIVFGDAAARAALEAITHPAIFEQTNRRLAELAAAGHPAAVVDAALMVETGSWRLYDGVLVVRCGPAVQRDRLISRDRMSAAEADARLAAQLAPDEKARTIRDAGGRVVVIDNDGPIDALPAAVEAAWEALALPLPEGPLAAALSTR